MTRVETADHKLMDIFDAENDSEGTRELQTTLDEKFENSELMDNTINKVSQLQSSRMRLKRI